MNDNRRPALRQRVGTGRGGDRAVGLRVCHLRLESDGVSEWEMMIAHSDDMHLLIATCCQ